jgi:hypothetical protein
MIEKFTDHRFQAPKLERIRQANEIIFEYQDAGYSLTLRQLYYQFVARSLMPNTDKEYTNLGNLLARARDAGLVGWDALEDRTRHLYGLHAWSSIPAFVVDLAHRFRMDVWELQDCYVEVWVEKEALIDVAGQACNGLQINQFPCRGYASTTAMYDAAKRFLEHADDGRKPVVLHLGDHDPSGIDMTRDIAKRLTMYSGGKVGDDCVKRIALNMDQIEEYKPPPNPAKISDTRAADYIRKYGNYSWELDALEPSVLVSLIRSEAEKYIDLDAVAEVQSQADSEREGLLDLVYSNSWTALK